MYPQDADAGVAGLLVQHSVKQMRFPHVARRLALVVAALGSIAGVARATPPATLLVNTSPSSMNVYDGIHVGGLAWSGTTALLASRFGAGLGTMPSLLDLDAMLQYGALWVDQRYQSAPLDVELSNILAFAGTGRRVVIVGENATWGPWNAAILGALGGAEGPGHDQLWYWMNGHGDGCRDGLANAVGTSVLTAGVATLNMACGGYAVGGTALFDYNVATLWGPQQNVLTVLDANVFDDRYIGVGDGVQFRENVVDWLGGSLDTVAPTRPVPLATPEPSTVALLGGGLLALGSFVRRRRVPAS